MRQKHRHEKKLSPTEKSMIITNVSNVILAIIAILEFLQKLKE